MVEVAQYWVVLETPEVVRTYFRRQLLPRSQPDSLRDAAKVIMCFNPL